MKSGADKIHSNSQWSGNDKSRLYNALLALQDKDSHLQALKQKVQQREKLAKIKNLRLQIKRNRDTLNSLKKEDMQRLKRTLQRHNMHILNEELTFEAILKKINYKVFTETNELNRLNQEEENLSKIYETKLIDLSKIQDRMVHVDQFQLLDEVVANRLRLDIKNCDTRSSSVKTLNQLCHKVINRLIQDFRSFDPALNALQSDIREQNALLEAIMKLELPATKDHQDLFSECRKLKDDVDNDMKIRLSTLNEFTSKIVTNSEAIKRLILSDADVKTKSKSFDSVNFTPSKDGSNEMIISQLKADLEMELKSKNLIENDFKFAEKIIVKIQSSFKHFKQILRQIGEDYEDQVDLESSPGETEILVSVVLHRCKVMMALFNEKILKNEIPANKMIFHLADIEDYSENEIEMDPDIMDDPNVPTRERIKALSDKLVELNLRENE
ncbi:hypothetical protein Bhyg_00647 [Pseudolycoriella hygida]|uniref:Uncharacterized protein n=1 Tax=Pseudolycoriella hygida TaxID=35572 RepID=A0A9Q0N9E8_9DIPT|nr:hypothetical protein Bhyg_00647 [Pseudolycoriella hygida]